ncbi:MAG TPA: hypothetical protein DCY13_12855 [Verrucomicrobiales bacterium]|nr:hypothetical protein [Verrucomicrobiales bacterium]
MRHNLTPILAALSLGGAALTTQAETGVELLWSAPFNTQYLDGNNNPVAVFGSNQNRGMAYNPISGNVLIVNNNSAKIFKLKGTDGTYQGEVDTTGPSGGFFKLNHVDVSEDGVIYACNLTLNSSTDPFKIYRWPDEAGFAFDPTTFERVGGYEGDPSAGDADATNRRFGDTFRVTGSGVNTRIIAASRGGKVLAYFTTVDGTNFTSVKITSDASAGDMGLGLAFGSGNEFWTKAPSRNLRRQSLNVAGGTATTINNIANTVIPNNVSPIAVNLASNILAGVLTGTSTTAGNHAVNLYDISNPAAPALILSTNFPAPIAANSNVSGGADFHNDLLFALDTNNGLLALKLVYVAPPPPAFTAQPGDVSVYEGGRVTLSTTATGAAPLSYQWNFNDTPITGATSASYTIPEVEQVNAGNYSVTVSNVSGSITSTNAALTALASVRTAAATPLWTAAPGSVAHITSSGDTQRGMAYNPVTGNLLLVSRAGSTAVHVIDGNTGATLRQLDVTGVTGGTFSLNMVGVADDGAVYACNLVLGGSLRIYRWASDAGGTPPTIAFDAAPDSTGSHRYGDTMDVRGSGANTQILMGSNTLKNFVVLTTADGLTFTSQTFEPDVPASSFRLGISFGAGNTIWGKNTGAGLRKITFDPGAGTATETAFFDVDQVVSFSSALDVIPEFGILGLLSLEVSDHLRLYDFASTPDALTLLDQDFFPTDNANINGVGAVAFGGGKVFVLDTNNGIIAYNLAPLLRLTDTPGAGFELRWSEGTLQSSSTVNGTYAPVNGATSPRVVTPAGTGNEFFRVQE